MTPGAPDAGPNPERPPGVEALLLLAERVADRLQVVGPRMAARESVEAQAVLDDVHAVLQQLADAAAGARGDSLRLVPRLAPHALGDQVLVLAHEVVAAGSPTAVATAHDLLADLKRRI